jgi:hypothetical protein
MYNPLAKRIGNVMEGAVAKEQARKKAAQPTQSKVPSGYADGNLAPSKDPVMIAAVAAAKKRSDEHFAAKKAAENVVPKITRK